MRIFFEVHFLYFGGKLFFPSIAFAFSITFSFIELSIFTLKKSLNVSDWKLHPNIDVGHGFCRSWLLDNVLTDCVCVTVQKLKPK